VMFGNTTTIFIHISKVDSRSVATGDFPPDPSSKQSASPV